MPADNFRLLTAGQTAIHYVARNYSITVFQPVFENLIVSVAVLRAEIDLEMEKKKREKGKKRGKRKKRENKIKRLQEVQVQG